MFQPTIPLPEKALSRMKAYYGATFLKWNGALFISSRRVLTASTSRNTLPLLRQHEEGVLHQGVILKYMFECNRISLCSANTTSLVATNNTWWITSVITRYSNHSSEKSVEEKGWEKSLVFGARNRMWLDDKYTNHDLSFCFPHFHLVFFVFSYLVRSKPIMLWRNLLKILFFGSPCVVFWLTWSHPMWFPRAL